jgi:hypothetical protein
LPTAAATANGRLDVVAAVAVVLLVALARPVWLDRWRRRQQCGRRRRSFVRSLTLSIQQVNLGSSGAGMREREREREREKERERESVHALRTDRSERSTGGVFSNSELVSVAQAESEERKNGEGGETNHTTFQTTASTEQGNNYTVRECKKDSSETIYISDGGSIVRLRSPKDKKHKRVAAAVCFAI